MSFVDITVRPPAPTELRRFSERLGAQALLDRDARLYRDLGLAYLTMDDEDILRRLIEDPRLLRLPLVRVGREMSAGPDDVAWKRIAGGAGS